MRLRQPVLHACLNHAPVTLLTRDVSQPVFAASDLAYLDPSRVLPVSFRFHFSLTLALTRAVMHSPQLICIFVRLLLNPCLANRAYYDIKLIPIAPNFTSMIVRSSVVSTEYFTAVLALEGHEVPLMAFRQLAMLSYLRFKHFIKKEIFVYNIIKRN